jgi:glycyl-tRNA synthetase alpha subunit
VPLGHFYNVLVIKCQHTIFELLCAKQAKSANHVTEYVSRLSTLF